MNLTVNISVLKSEDFVFVFHDEEYVFLFLLGKGAGWFNGDKDVLYIET